MTDKTLNQYIRELEQSRQNFYSLFESSPVGLIYINFDGLICTVNKLALDYFGYTREEILKLKVESLVPERFRSDHLNFRALFFQKKETRPMGYGRDLFALRKDGGEFPVEISLIHTNLGPQEGVIASIVDITKRKVKEKEAQQYRESLERSNQELAEYAYIVSHDIREPLRMIAGYAQLLRTKHKEGLDKEGKDYVDTIFSSAQRMQDLVNDLLIYSTLDRSGKEYKRFDCNKTLNNVKENLRTKIERSNAQISYDHLPEIFADPIQVEQLFQNLIDNAIKYCKQKPQVDITVKDEGDFWRFSFKDNGIGIEEQNLGEIFKVFKRLHTQSEYEGTGIGLSICKKIVLNHSGDIWVESVLGQGTIFHFILPKGF